MANDALLPYTEEMTALIQQGGNYIVDSFERLREVVNLAFDDPRKKATVYFGTVAPDMLARIMDNVPNLPKDLEGALFREGRTYSIAATLDAIRHMADEKNLSREDIIDYLDRFADAILEFDSVTFDYYYQGESKTPGLLFKKAFDDGTLFSFNLVSQKKRSLALQTLYLDTINYQKRKRSAETLLMRNSPSLTPEAQVGQTSTDIISDSGENSNPSGENISSTRRYSLPESGESADFVYTREQYEHFGWAHEAGGITFNELNDLESKIKEKRSVSDFYHSQQGEFIVAVNDDPNRGQGVNNVLVFLKGTKANHTITRTIRFDARTEMEMEEFTDNVFSERTFDSEACTILEEVGIATEYRRRGAPSHSEYLAKKRKRGESGGDIQNSSPDRSGNQRRGATEGGGEAGGGDAVSGRRYSLPEATLAATEGSVRARQEEYEPRALERVTGAAQRAYIEGVNAQYGIERLLRKNGMSRAEAESLMQITRAAESQAQAMIGGRQYDIFSDNPEDMGEGLMQILEPVRRWSDERQTLLQQYLLHSLNVDRMTLLIFSAFFAKALVISRAFVLQ